MVIMHLFMFYLCSLKPVGVHGMVNWMRVESFQNFIILFENCLWKFCSLNQVA